MSRRYGSPYSQPNYDDDSMSRTSSQWSDSGSSYAPSGASWNSNTTLAPQRQRQQRQPIVFRISKIHKISEDLMQKNRNDVVRGPDSDRVLYTLDYPYTANIFKVYKLNMTLYRGQDKREDAMVCRIKRNALDGLDLKFPDGFKTTMSYGSMIRVVKDFRGRDGTEYSWKAESVSSQDFKCVNKRDDSLVATWQAGNMIMTSPGTLTIQPQYDQEQELLLASALALAESNRQRNTNNYW